MIVLRVETAEHVNLNGVIEAICTACGHRTPMQEGVLIIPEGLIPTSEESDSFVSQLTDIMSRPVNTEPYQREES